VLRGLLDTAVPSDDPFTLKAPPVPELRLSDSVSSGFGDKSANYELAARDRAALRASEGRCADPARGIRWRMPDGSLEPVACGRSNSCDYCAMRAAVEAALVLKLDAEICMPTVGITTTTRSPDFTLEDLRRAEQELWRAMRTGRRIGVRGPRRRDESRYEAFPQLRYCAFLEWTSGRGTHAGGVRRPHLHHLVKGIPIEHPLLVPVVLDDGKVTNALERRVSELWAAATGGDAFVVECRPLRTPVGAIRYLALHHKKKAQAPPADLKKKTRRLRASRKSQRRPGYYEQPVAELRELARRVAAHERVEYAASRAIAAELHGQDEFDVDAQMTTAIVAALRDMAERPLELQIDLSGEVDVDVEHREFVARAIAEIERIRADHPPELVHVIERENVDHATGTTVREAVAVVGPIGRRKAAAA
jgi:hypothetical protein